MLSSYKHRQAHKPAFTVVEMLVVIVVVALLATIGFLGYNGWRDDVASTEVMSDLTSLHSSMDNAKSWSQGEDSGYPALDSWTSFDGSGPTKDIFTPSPGVQVMYVRGDNDNYCIEGFSKNRENIYYYLDSTEGAVKKGTCSGGENATPPPTSLVEH